MTINVYGFGDYETVVMFADLNGPSEDFDGLVSALEDYSETLDV